MSLHVHIERVILDGVPLEQGQRERLRERLVAALSELFARGELDWSRLEAGDGVVRAPTVRLPRQLSTSAFAESVAESVHAGLTAPQPSAPASPPVAPQGGPIHG